MEVICSQCNAKLNIPDDKIPRDQTVKINCPKCKNKITISAQDSAPQETQEENHSKEPEGPVPDESQKKTEQEKPDEDEDYGEGEALDFYEEDTKLALIMVGADIQEKTARALEELDHTCVISPDSRDALGKLRFHHFDVVLLADGFDGQDFSNSPIMNQMNHMSMTSRRKIFLALMSDKFKTMDDVMAYSMSANIVINSKEIDKLSKILKRGISEYSKFYKVFMDTLVEVGKA